MREKGCARLCFLLRSTAITLFSLPDRRGHQALRKECSMPAPSPISNNSRSRPRICSRPIRPLTLGPRCAYDNPPRTRHLLRRRDSPDQARPQRHPARHCRECDFTHWIDLKRRVESLTPTSTFSDVSRPGGRGGWLCGRCRAYACHRSAARQRPDLELPGPCGGRAIAAAARPTMAG